MTDHRRWMKAAIREAEKAFEADEVPVGAVVVHHGMVVGKGYNQVERLSDPTAHAEIIAITAACDRLQTKHLTEATLYVTLEPCPMCAGAAFWTRIGRVVYGASDEKRGFSRWNTERAILHPKTEVVSGVLEAECSALVKEFFAQKRRRKG
jgi:tRNA(adenine34) deaminase